MKEFVLFDKDWGNLILSFSFSKLEILPRFALKAMSCALVVKIEFLTFSLMLMVWNEPLRRFNRKNREQAEQ